MRRPSRPRLDLLPLLDVFMVVMFALATIEEERAAAGEDSAERELRLRQAVERRAEAERRAASERLRAATAKRPLAPRSEDVLARLLAVHGVVEVEVAGELQQDGRVVNRCCFRRDPRDATWDDCGAAPVDAAAAERWLTDDGSRLGDALGGAKGSVLVVLRQDAIATYDIAHKLGALVRRRYPGVRVDAGGVTTTLAMCSSPGAE